MRRTTSKRLQKNIVELGKVNYFIFFYHIYEFVFFSTNK